MDSGNSFVGKRGGHFALRNDTPALGGMANTSGLQLFLRRWWPRSGGHSSPPAVWKQKLGRCGLKRVPRLPALTGVLHLQPQLLCTRDPAPHAQRPLTLDSVPQGEISLLQKLPGPTGSEHQDERTTGCSLKNF